MERAPVPEPATRLWGPLTTVNDVIEGWKQARLGWSTVRLARHYTDSISVEDRRAADHIGTLLDASEVR
jgi:hypothetical protein